MEARTHPWPRPLCRLIGRLLLGGLIAALPAWAAAADPETGGPLRAGQSRSELEPARLKAAGVRTVRGRHLTLHTDVMDDPEVDALPAILDQAVPAWCRYFGVEPDRAESWQLTGYLIDRKERFAALGLLPDDLPPFLHGYHRGQEVWLYEQPTAYYRRHLLLHEGTHAFMHRFLGGAGPPWYMEGMAELLGTHRWREGRLSLGVFPADKSQTPGWGRIKIVRDELAQGNGMTLPRIMQYDERAHLRNAPYGWCWAAAAFLDRHPATRKAFRARQAHVAETGLDFSRDLYRDLAGDWSRLQHEWQLFVMQLDYGYDISRGALAMAPERTVPDGGVEVSIAADRGWQSTGLRIEAGEEYTLRGSGRYQVAREPDVWWCEPGGVTIRYVEGHPLGMLLAAICDVSQPPAGLSPLTSPLPVGQEQHLRAPRSGILFLKINEHPAELADNDGSLTVRVVPD